MENIYATMAEKIVAEQSKVIGPIAYSEASKVPGLSFDKTTHAASIAGDGMKTIDALVQQYKVFFGNTAVAVSKEAVGNMRFSVSQDQLPASLR